MSLVTVATTVQPDRVLASLPPSRPERFQPADFKAAGLVFIITLGVYIATLAPNVTLEDSGELITAATKFGVGHPPGYPLWTLTGFLLSHLFPFGNLAWRINLMCALFGAVSNGVLTLLVCHSGRWMLQRWTEAPLQPVVRQFTFYAGVLSGLTIGFSNVMWSQAVISAVHGTLNALFANSVLLFFYLWMIEPKKIHRLILAVFVFALGLTNHHTLIQIIPAFLIAAFLIQVIPAWLGKPQTAPAGLFFSVLLAVNLFSLSILVYISWLSSDSQLRDISDIMAWLILGSTAVISFFYLKEFRLRLFLTGALLTASIFAFGHYLMSVAPEETLRYTSSTGPFWLRGSFVHPGWLQITTPHGFVILGLAVAAVGMLFTSQLDRRLVLGVFAVGWLGLMPYAYEPFASDTHPPMNWGMPKERSGFYYAVSREQYPKSLPNLIKMTFGKAVGVVPKDAHLDATIDLPDYWPHLWLTFYYYGDNLQQNFTVPLISLALAMLLYLRRCDWPQVNWLIFLAMAWFCLGFMLQLIAPQDAFDFERNLQYKVFHLQSHCILVILMGYGALAAMTYLNELMPEITAGYGALGFGMPGIYLALLPLWSNFDECNQAEHWYGWDYGHRIMAPLAKNGVFYGGSDAGRFVPTYMAFVESQQDSRWKRDPAFDRRDVAVITQNALCDTYYCQYIRDQYDARFRPAKWTPFERWLGRDQAYPQQPVECVSNDELLACWSEYQARPEVAARIKKYGPGGTVRPGTNDVFEINGIVAQKIFEKNKKDHTFYLEQSVPIEWMYPYLLPFGTIFQLSPEPLNVLPADAIARDHRYWDDLAARLLNDPKFRLDDDATLTFGKLAYWHADLYRYRHLDQEQEYWLKIALKLCPQLSDAVNSLSRLYYEQHRYDEGLAVLRQAMLDDPRNDTYQALVDWIARCQKYGEKEKELRAGLAKAPYDVAGNLQLARLLQDEGKYAELNDRLRLAAGLTNWTQDAMSDLVNYYVDQSHDPEAAIAFLEARAKIDPTAGEMIYNLAALHATQGHADQAVKYLTQAATISGTNALLAAGVDPRFETLRTDPRFQNLLGTVPSIHDTNFPSPSPAVTNAAPLQPKTK